MKKLAVLALAATMSVSAFAVKIGIVNTQEVVAKYSGTKRVKQELSKEMQKLEKNIKSKQLELQIFDLQLQGKGSNVSEEDKKKFLAQKKALEVLMVNSQKVLSQKEYEKMNPIYSTIDASIQSIAQNGKYDYVLEAGADKFGGTDITQDVLKMMESTKKIDL